MSTLLTLDTPDVSVIVKGPKGSSATMLSGDVWPIPRNTVEPSQDARFRSVFPLFFEEEDYELLVQARRRGVPLHVSHRDARLCGDLRLVDGAEPATVIGRVRFRQAVGLTTFHIMVGEKDLWLTLEIFPAKLDYAEDYDALVSGVQEIERVLPLRYFAETFHRTSSVPEEPSSSVEWLSILRDLVGELIRALRYADAHPLLSLSSTLVETRVERVKRPSSEVVRAVLGGRGAGAWVAVGAGSGAPARSLIPVDEQRDSLDSAEHRWLRRNLDVVARQIALLRQQIATAIRRTSVRFPSRVGDKDLLRQQDAELSDIESQIMSIGSLAIIRGAHGRSVVSNFSSLRLLRSPGYSDAYGIMMALKLGLSRARDGGGSTELSIQKLGALYEVWCFVEVLCQLEKITGILGTRALGGFSREAPLGLQLATGEGVYASFELPDGRLLSIRYNRRYPTLTGEHRPDIELEFKKPGRPPIVVLLDAKYRLDNSPSSVQSFGLPAPPTSALWALHRYRDAIVVRTEAGNYRPVVQGVALYPLSAAESVNWADSTLRASLAQYGIGAIPLLPGNTSHLKSWLEGILQLEHEELAASSPLGPSEVPTPNQGGAFTGEGT